MSSSSGNQSSLDSPRTLPQGFWSRRRNRRGTNATNDLEAQVCSPAARPFEGTFPMANLNTTSSVISQSSSLPFITGSQSSTAASASLAGGSSVANTTSASSSTSTAPTTISQSPPPSTTPRIWEIQGVVLHHRVEKSARKPYDDLLNTPVNAGLFLACGPDGWMLEFMMAGTRPWRLTPSLIVWCQDSKIAAEARKYFKEDRWITENLGGTKYYIFDQPPPLRSARLNTTCSYGIKVADGCSLAIASNTTTACGMAVMIESDRQAKIIAMILVDGEPCLIAPRHCLDGPTRVYCPGSTSIGYQLTSRRDVCKVQSDGDSSSESGSVAGLTQQSRSGEPGALTSTTSNVQTDTRTADCIRFRTSIFYPQVVTNEGDTHNHLLPDFDWLVVDLADAPSEILDKVLQPNLVEGIAVQEFDDEDFEDEGPVVIALSHDETCAGLLSPVKSSLMVNGSFHEVMPIELEKTLPLGCSGALVLRNNRACGFIIAVRHDLPWAYMIPMRGAISNMKSVLGADDICLPSTEQLHDLRADILTPESRGNQLPDHTMFSQGLSRSQRLIHSPKRLENVDAQSTRARSRNGSPHIDITLIKSDMDLEVPFHFEDCDVRQALDKPVASYAPKIWAEIHNRMHKNFEGQNFIPFDELEALFALEVVLSLIDEDESISVLLPSQHARIPFAMRVRQSAVRLLALCIYVNINLASLHRLIMAGIDDASLPFRTASHSSLARLAGIRQWQWQMVLDVQSGFAPYDFQTHSKDEHHYLDDEAVLPIIYDKSTDLVGEGSSAQVYRVTIHPGYHGFSGDRQQQFAVKRFYEQGSKSQIALENEIRALRRLGSEPHIVELIASWTQSGRSYILMPLAVSNLGDFLRTVPSPRCSAEGLFRLYSQLRNLAEGLHLIHNLPYSGGNKNEDYQHRYGTVVRQNYMGVHHDIKPDNILVFHDHPDGTPAFKIADFGLSTISLSTIGSNMDPESYPAHNWVNATYAAPEIALDGQASRACDVWSLGAVFCEVLSWIFGGPGSDPDAFASERSQYNPGAERPVSLAFWYRDHDANVHLNPAVAHKLNMLQRESDVKLRRLAALVWNMLSVNPDDRPDSLSVRVELDMIVSGDNRGAVFELSDLDSASSSSARTGSNDTASTRPSSVCEGSPPPAARQAKRITPCEEEQQVEADEHLPMSHKSKTVRLSPTVPRSESLFACPFSKFDPGRYSEANPFERTYRRCSSVFLTNIPRLKQHLYRVHSRPAHYCASCFTTFASAEARRVHERMKFCELQTCPFEEKMTEDQCHLIKRKQPVSDPAQVWKETFTILFPGTPCPSPYVESTSQGSSGSLEDFMPFFEREGPSILANELHVKLFGENSAELVPFTNSILEEALPVALRRLREKFSQVEESNSPQNEAPAAQPAADHAADIGK